MKQIFKPVLTFMLILFIISSSVLAFGANRKYDIRDLDMTIEMPEGLYVFTRDMEEDDPALDFLGMSAEEVEDSLSEMGVYLSAFSIEPYEYNIEIASVPIISIDRAGLLELSEEELLGAAQDAAESIKGMSDALMDITPSTYKTENAAFIVLDYYVDFFGDGFGIPMRMYYTVNDYGHICIALQYYEEVLPRELETQLKEVLDSVEFAQSGSSIEDAGESILSTIASMRVVRIAGIVLLIVIVILVMIRLEKKKRKEREQNDGEFQRTDNQNSQSHTVDPDKAPDTGMEDLEPENTSEKKEAPKYCDECGAKIQLSQKFCSLCGKKTAPKDESE